MYVCVYIYKIKEKQDIYISRSVQGHRKENHVCILYASIIFINSLIQNVWVNFFHI